MSDLVNDINDGVLAQEVMVSFFGQTESLVSISMTAYYLLHYH